MFPHGRLSRPLLLACCLVLFSLAALPLWGQLPSTQLGAVFPPGATPDSTVEVTVTGSVLDGVDRLNFSHPGITAERKMSPPGPFDEQPQPVPNEFVVRVAANVPPGLYEVRASGKYGVSNPRAFLVGDLPEQIEEEPNDGADEAMEVSLPVVINGRCDQAADVDFYTFTAQRGQRILIDCRARRIDSRMAPTLIVYDQSGRELGNNRNSVGGDSLLDFTVPANGAYYVKVCDALFAGGPDYFYRLAIGELPHIDFILPPAGLPGSNGQYTVYGRNLPGGQPAGTNIAGQPLQKQTVSIRLPNQAVAGPLTLNCLLGPERAGLDGVEYRLPGPQGLSNPVLVGLATAPVVMEQEPNNTSETAQKIEPPCEVVGQFYPQRDEDWFTFEAKAGDVYTLEVISQRLGTTPTNPRLLIQKVTLVEVEKEGEEVQEGEEEATAEVELREEVRVVAVVEDFGQPRAAAEFDTRTDDPMYRLEVDEDATYRVQVRDAYSTLRDDPRYVYRLAIRREKPDFRLAAVPLGSGSGLVLRRGERARVKVVAFRQDNFSEEIRVSISGLPDGVTCPEVIIGPARNSATLVLTAAENAPAGFAQVQIEGKAQVGESEVTRVARTGGALWPLPPGQGNQPQLSGPGRVTRSLVVSVLDSETNPIALQAGDNTVWEVSRAGALKIPYSLTRRGDYQGKIDVSGADLPENVEVKNFALEGGTTSGEFELELKNNAPVGTYTFYLNTVGEKFSYRHNPEAAEAAAERKEEVDQIAAEAAEAAKAAEEAKAAADKAAQEAEAALKAAEEARAAAQTKARETATAAENAAYRAAEAKAAAAQDAEDANLAKAAADAEKAAADAAAAAKEAADAVVDAQKKLDETQDQAKQATEDQEKADMAAQEAAELAEAAQQAKAAADKRATDLAEAAKPKEVNVRVASTPITLKITPAPITLDAPPKATLKPGESTELAVAIKRLYNFNDAVTLTAALPDGVGGLQIPNATIAAGQNQDKLVLNANENATPGIHEVTVRAALKLNNQDLVVTAPVVVEVVEVEAEEAEEE